MIFSLGFLKFDKFYFFYFENIELKVRFSIYRE